MLDDDSDTVFSKKSDDEDTPKKETRISDDIVLGKRTMSRLEK